MVANEKLLIRQTINRNSKQKVNNSIDEFCTFQISLVVMLLFEGLCMTSLILEVVYFTSS